MIARTLAAILLAAPAAAETLSPRLCDGGTLSAPRVQVQGGHLDCAPPPGGGTPAFHAYAGPKSGRKVGKADAIVPFPMAVPGDTVSVSVTVFIPSGRPRDSVHLLDLECKHCGIPGNPGLRLYLRDGRLRVDRAKIGGGHAWTNDRAPRLPAGEWARIDWQVRLGDQGATLVALNGDLVLRGAGRTVPAAPGRAGVDRLQAGVTANSNRVAAEVWMRDLGVTITRSSLPDG